MFSKQLSQKNSSKTNIRTWKAKQKSGIDLDIVGIPGSQGRGRSCSRVLKLKVVRPREVGFCHRVSDSGWLTMTNL